MKMKIKLYFLTSLLVLTTSQSYAMTICETYVAEHSACGSGKIRLAISEPSAGDDTNFIIDFGDVGCWFTDKHLIGKVNSHDLHSNLVIQEKDSEGKFTQYVIGNFRINNAEAKLQMNRKIMSSISEIYTLNCREL